VLAVHTGSLELSAEHYGRMDYPPSILGRELLVPSCAHAVMLPGVSRLAPQARAALPRSPSLVWRAGSCLAPPPACPVTCAVSVYRAYVC